MEFGKGKPRVSSSQSSYKRNQTVPIGDIEHLKKYPYPVNMYSVPPFGNISLDDAEDMVFERINILKVFDEVNVAGKDYRDDWLNEIDMKLENAQSKWMTNFYKGGKPSVSSLNYDHRKRDHTSHFLLRLYYCRDEELRKWFVWHESELFRFRLMMFMKKESVVDFLKAHNLKYDTVTDNEKTAKKLLMGKKVNWNGVGTSESTLYKMKFTDALELVRTRRVYLEDGYAYILQNEMVSIVVNHFKMELKECLARMLNELPALEEEERLLPRLHTIHYEAITKRERAARELKENGNREPVTPEMIDELAKESFPPCMRSVHENLRKNHHLKHYGRLHYGLFLKSIGVSLDDALKFFREEFIKSVTPEKFQKEYSYNIRYNYGKEGKKLNLSGYSCQKIITENPPGPGDSHGCPFRHFDTANLKTTLRRYGADETALEDILARVTEKRYTDACKCFFSAKHPNHSLRVKDERGPVIYHPNQFYTESRRAVRGYDNEMASAAGGDTQGSAQTDANVDEFMDDEISDEQLVAVSQQPEAENVAEPIQNSENQDVTDKENEAPEQETMETDCTE
ncbi:DNA primase large subunit [Halotydeus destructor]|nr:DNA primase large subunit [Halotydeus destructor]